MVLQIIQSISIENPQKIHLQTQRKKVLVLKERKNLKAEIVGLKTLALKNTVKKELNLKIFLVFSFFCFLFSLRLNLGFLLALESLNDFPLYLLDMLKL